MMLKDLCSIFCVIYIDLPAPRFKSLPATRSLLCVCALQVNKGASAEGPEIYNLIFDSLRGPDSSRTYR